MNNGNNPFWGHFRTREEQDVEVAKWAEIEMLEAIYRLPSFDQDGRVDG